MLAAFTLLTACHALAPHVRLPQTNVLRAPAAMPAVSRRAVLAGLAAAATVRISAAYADEDDEEASAEDIPLLSSTSGMKTRSKPGQNQKKSSYTAAEAAFAYAGVLVGTWTDTSQDGTLFTRCAPSRADIVACRSGVGTIEQLVRNGEFASAAGLLGRPPFSSFKHNALVLVNSKALAPDDIKAIGTEKRFGISADVIIMCVCMYIFGVTSTRAYTRAQARGATPELRRVADTTSHGLSAGRHSTQTTIGSPSLRGRPRGEYQDHQD